MLVLHPQSQAEPLVGEIATHDSLRVGKADSLGPSQRTQPGNRLKIRGFATSISEVSAINNKSTLANGGQLALLINRHLWLGAYALTTVGSTRDIVAELAGAAPERYTKFTQVGGVVGYSFRPKRAIHVAVSSRVGAGFLNRAPSGRLAAVAFVAAPEAGVELNLRRWLRASLGVGYRFVRSNDQLTRQNKLSSPTVALGVSFGWFD